MNSYQPVPVDQVTTEDLIVTIARDRNDIATFEARRAFVSRCGDWRTYAPAAPRTHVDTDGGRVYYHNFCETGLL